MAVDPLAVAGAAGTLAQDIFGQQGPTTVEKNLARESQNKQGAPIALSLANHLATMGLSDRAAYLLAQRLSPGVAGGGTFTPHDLFNGGSPAQTEFAGPDNAALNRANEAYTPGMGGFDPSVAKQALANLGSSHDQSYSTNAGGGTPWAAGAFDPTQTPGQKAAADAAAKKKKSTIFGGGVTLPRTATSGFAPGGING